MNTIRRKTMSKGLEKIVASLELCKLIPAGEFEDTALIHVLSPHGPCVMERPYGTQCEYFPAPTVDEIMEKLDAPVLWRSDNGKWRCLCNHVLAQKRENASEAALRMWLRVKGIEVK